MVKPGAEGLIWGVLWVTFWKDGYVVKHWVEIEESCGAVKIVAAVVAVAGPRSEMAFAGDLSGSIYYAVFSKLAVVMQACTLFASSWDDLLRMRGDSLWS